jgi:cyclic pyranopterin phosphate synthase
MPELQPMARAHGSVARRYRLPGAVGTVGLISPVSCSFCSECNRIRLTADGFMKPCLHSAAEFPLRGKHGDALRDAIRAAVNAKPEAHIDFTGAQRSESARNMNQIGG